MKIFEVTGVGKLHGLTVMSLDSFVNKDNKEVEESAGKTVHRIGLTVTDPNHPMVSKRGETYHKTVRVTGDDREKAINGAIAHARRKGYKVHDHHYIGTVEDTVKEGVMSDLHLQFADVYDELAPGIEKHKDSVKAGQLYDALKLVAEKNGAVSEFKRMMMSARNSAHQDYDTNPGGFENWFWYLPFGDELGEGFGTAAKKAIGAGAIGLAALGAGGAQAQTTDKYDPDWNAHSMTHHIRSDVSLTKGINSADPSQNINDFQKRIQKVTGPNAKGEYKVVVLQGNDIVSHYVTKTPPPEWLYKEDVEGNGDPDIQPGMKTQYGTVVSVKGNNVVVKASNGDETVVNIHNIQQAVAEGADPGLLFYAKIPDGSRVYARVKDAEHLANLQQQYRGSEIKTFDFRRPDILDWLEARGINLRKFTPGMVQTMYPGSRGHPKSTGLNEFAPGNGGDDDSGEDPYRYPKPEHFSRSVDFFGQFEADHFDREDMNDATGEFKGYWGKDQVAYFKFDNPQRTGSDNPGMGWYYEPNTGSNNNNTKAKPAVDNADERKQQQLGMIDAFLKSGQKPKPGSQIHSLMKQLGLAEGELKGVAEGGEKYKVKSIGHDAKGDYYISPSTGKKVYKSGVKRGDHENPNTGEIKKNIAEAPGDFGLGANYRAVPDDEMQDLMGRSKNKTKTKRDKYDYPYIHGSNIEVKDEAGKTFDTEALKKSIMVRPASILGQNAKMQHSETGEEAIFDIGLPALKGLAVNEKTGEFVVVDTCPGAGECKTFCYAMKGSYVMFKAVSMGLARMLNFLLNDPTGFANKLNAEITAAKAKMAKKNAKVVVRWHDAGDFFSAEYLDMAYGVANANPDVGFYAYTKMADVATGARPKNFNMNFSGGALSSQEKKIDFKRVKHSKVVPKDMFFDLIARDGNNLKKDAKGRMQFASPANLEQFKSTMAQKYAIDRDSILTYDEMMKTPVGDKPQWNTIVMPGDGDNSANRNDVIGSYLLFH